MARQEEATVGAGERLSHSEGHKDETGTRPPLLALQHGLGSPACTPFSRYIFANWDGPGPKTAPDFSPLQGAALQVQLTLRPGNMKEQLCMLTCASNTPKTPAWFGDLEQVMLESAPFI